MKKTILFISIIMALFSSTTVFAEDCNIECTAEVTGQNVCVSGKITNVTQSHQVTLLVGETDNILYIKQVATTDDGSFIFNFGLPDTLSDGSYNFRIGSDTGAEPFDGVLVYGTPDDTEEHRFFDGNIVVSVSSYIPTITGSIRCIDGKEISFNVVNSTDNIVIAQDSISAADGDYNLSYTLPSLVSGKNYAVTISGSEGETSLFNIDVEINSSIIFVSVSGEVQLADDVKLDVRAKTSNSDLIDKSATFTADRSVEVTIPNLVANVSCDISMQGYEMAPKSETEPSPDPDPTPEPDPEPLPDADDGFQTVETAYTVDGNTGTLKRVIININNIPKLNHKIFTIAYDTSKLELVDACAFTAEKNTTTGAVEGTYIEILSVVNGQMTFKINKEFSGNVVTSGTVNMLTFKKLTAETASVTSKIEKAQ